MQAVPRSHPQLVLLGQCVLAVGLQRLSAVPVVVHTRLSLLAHTQAAAAAAAVSLNRHLGDTVFGAEPSDVRGPQGAGGGGGAAGAEVGVGGGGEARARPELRLLRAPLDADGLLVGHAQFVQFLEVLAEAAGGAPLQVVGVGHPASSHDGAVVREVDAAVDVAVAVGQSGPLGLAAAAALLPRDAVGLVALVDHQLNPLYLSLLRTEEEAEEEEEKGGVKVNVCKILWKNCCS